MTGLKLIKRAAPHPLDPLSAEEVVSAANICRAYVAEKGLGAHRFNTITLSEPPKADLLAFERGGKYPTRMASVVMTKPPKSNPIEMELNLEEGSVVSYKTVEGVQVAIIYDDFYEVGESLFKADPHLQDLCKEYGIESMDSVAVDTWPIHPVDDEMGPEHRLFMGLMYWRSSEDDNQYAHPLPWVPILDVESRKVIRIETAWKGPAPVAKLDGNYHHKLLEGKPRTDIKPLDIIQPEGPSFTVDGNLIKWQKWQIRVSFNWREGLVLHNVGYEDEGRLRPIMYRASIAEMAVPYAEAQEPHHRRLAFDLGDVGIGQLTNSLELGCDCLGHIHYFDAVLNNSKGEPYVIKKAICVHEEDAGIIWKHTELRNMHPEVRRGRKLVISFIATVANYEYGFYWYFGQDGAIQHEVKLTGEVSTTLASPEDGNDPRFGTLVLPNVLAAHHQHLFCARLDMAVDDEDGGRGLVVSEVDTVPLPVEENPWHSAFMKRETDLTNEASAARVVDSTKARFWKIKNPAKRHVYSGHAASYKLVPANTQLLLGLPTSTTAERASFATKSLWVTPYDEAERYPGGDYPLQNVKTGGVAQWSKKGRLIAEGNDPVVWHVFGATHLVRPEDFPVMPVETVGFHLKPVSFFKQNPALDLPRTVNTASKLAGSCCGANGQVNGATNRHANGYTNGHSEGIVEE
ncbi:Primary amine oxidase [Coccomyxa sp. Obi]|nr:Primary amine oxidase [Coccomyxa sp. Obi]